MKRITFWVILFVLIVVGLFTVKLEAAPSPATRVILEHTYQTYITPPCYEAAQKTNNIAEATLQKAEEANYKPESSCTESSLQPAKQPIAYVIAEKLGIGNSQWDW
ncbi:hypothetical protein [Brevibacillus reuszeri]|uniref:hypothetical protein n=1 Tax=Brevibacillus reuszeri TaxID=54915 RepID=UPI002896DA82|nr:hypothetical protein [Brevibacillus reuszeri]